jgi:hypothetical protein
MIELKPDLTVSEAMKIDQLCSRILGDIGSIHARITPQQQDGRARPMSPELVALRLHVREISDAVRDTYPEPFFK